MEYLRLMAGRTFSIRVFTEKWKTRQVMIEKYVFLPGLFIMTIAAHCALRSAVRVIALVTVAATCQRLCFKQGLNVAR